METCRSRNGTTITFVLLTMTDAEVHRRRLESRDRALVHVGEPAWDQVRVRSERYEPWVGPCTEIDASRPLDEVIGQVLAVVA